MVEEFDVLDEEFFKELFEFTNQKKVKKSYFSPADYQKDIIKAVREGFKKNDRGKLIAACGTGKTLTSLWISEDIKANKVLFLAPSLALIKQTLEAWSEQSKEDFSYLCVCSDKTVSNEVDSGDITIEDFNVPVSTSPDEINIAISQKRDEKFVIFSTYQSLDVLSQGINKTDNFIFDLIIFDEAHRTAGASDSGLFSLALYNENILAKKRLFMTATERLIKPWIAKKAKELNRVVFSMDDESLYGPVFYRFSFGDAIQKKVISDYRIIVAGIRDNEIYEWIKSNKFLACKNTENQEFVTYAQNVFKQIVLIKAIKSLGIKKCISFHGSVKYAKEFIFGVSLNDFSFQKAIEKVWPEFSEKDVFLNHINGTMNAGERKQLLDIFKASEYGLISNSRCLTEGVDVPIIDSIYFVDSKNSLIDIVQACGRALRKPRDRDDKIAYFIIPVLLPDVPDAKESINQVDFEMLHNLIQSLRDQDQRLEQWIDNINLSATKGKTHKFSRNSASPIVLNLPEGFDVKNFEESLYLKIADVNKNPTNTGYKTIKYGKKGRKSDYKRIFKTLGDYSISSYRDNLVIPTLDKFSKPFDHKKKGDLKINHNNISHTDRLGLIITDEKKYRLSPLGQQLFENKASFENIFRQQMLRYFSTQVDNNQKRILFPYRTFLKVLLEVKTISFFDFVFALYPMIDSTEESISEAINGIFHIQKNYPNMEMISLNNQSQVLKELNEFFGTNFTEHDIWHKRTTIVNQYIYFRNHLALFEDLIEIDEKEKIIKLKYGEEERLKKLLDKDSFIESEKDENQLSKHYVSAMLVFILFSIL